MPEVGMVRDLKPTARRVQSGGWRAGTWKTTRSSKARMSERRRDELREEALAELEQRELGFPILAGAFVESVDGASQTDRSWHFFAYSYSSSFKVLWDAAYARRSGVFDYPLLFICRHSIELWLKLALSAVSGTAPPSGHQLKPLWRSLAIALGEETGMPVDDAFAASVRELIEILDEHDDKGDRFRYPVTSGSKPYPSTHADLDDLFRAHCIVTTYCDAVFTEMEVEQDVPF